MKFGFALIQISDGVSPSVEEVPQETTDDVHCEVDAYTLHGNPEFLAPGAEKYGAFSGIPLDFGKYGIVDSSAAIVERQFGCSLIELNGGSPPKDGVHPVTITAKSGHMCPRASTKKKK